MALPVGFGCCRCDCCSFRVRCRGGRPEDEDGTISALLMGGVEFRGVYQSFFSCPSTAGYRSSTLLSRDSRFMRSCSFVAAMGEVSSYLGSAVPLVPTCRLIALEMRKAVLQIVEALEPLAA